MADAKSGVSIERLRANGLEFACGFAGNGDKLLFLGGTGWDLRREPNPLTSPLVDHHRLFLFDQRGMGRSDKPDCVYTMADYCDDAAGLMAAAGWERAHIIGYSFGGMVAQELAIRHPEKVASLILGATTSGGDGGSSYPIQEFLSLGSHERARRGLEIADLRFTAQWQSSNVEAANQRVAQRAATQTQFINEPDAMRGLIRQLEARAGHDCFDRLSCITASTLVLAGRHDGQAPMEAVKALAANIPGANLEVVEGSHNFLFEGHEAYTLMISHLRRSVD